MLQAQFIYSHWRSGKKKTKTVFIYLWPKLNRKNKLEPGDIIFIPDRVDYNEWIAAKELVGALYQTGLLIYYIQTIIRNLNN